MMGRPMIQEASLKYTVVYFVEADSYETLEAAVEYVARRFGSGLVGYACGPYACFCEVEVKWSGNWLTVRSCTKQAARALAKSLIDAYIWLGGKEIQVVMHWGEP
jgi:hypothetical protein